MKAVVFKKFSNKRGKGNVVSWVCGGGKKTV
jgi:hypothetical protein